MNTQARQINITFGFLRVGLMLAMLFAAAAMTTIRAQSALDGFDPNANGIVRIVVVQPDGKILIGGDFTTIGGVTRNRIARLNADGTLDTAFDPNANGTVRVVVVQPDGKILVGGVFSGANSIGTATRNRIARLDATTGAADSFDPNANNAVNSIAVQSDGKILVGGQFSGANSIGGQPRNNIARLDATTGAADSFDPNANGAVFSIAIQSDGKILVGGFFNGANSIGTTTRNRIARLDATTGLADSFNPNANNIVFSIAVQADGKILVGGAFNGATSIGSQNRNCIARLDATTGLADSFDPNANNTVLSIAIQSDGKILVGGQFNGAFSMGGQTRNRIARLDATTGLADSFNPNANNIVYSIAVQSDGKILVGGEFSGANSIGGQTRSLFARLSNDTAALSALSVTKTTVTLTRNGSAAQFERVIFEQSTDNGATYTPLGTATNSRPMPAGDDTAARLFATAAPLASGYTLTGLNLPDGQNILIRARGFYRTGYQSGSETTEDKVQTAFLLAPTAAGVSISGRVITPQELGLTNALVTLTDSRGAARTIRTGKRGNFRFEEVAAGETYIISVTARRYNFAPQVISVTENITDLIFTTQQGGR